MSTSWTTLWYPRFVFPLVLTAVFLVSTGTGHAQDDVLFGPKTPGAVPETPGFGDAGTRSTNDRPALGTKGVGDYSHFLGRLSLVKPEEDPGGLWTVFRITRLLCNSLYQGRNTLVEVAPKGFAIARGDVHSLGFAGEHWHEDRYAISVTGDSEEDATGGHPFWETQYDEDGILTTCRVTIGPAPEREEAAPDTDHGAAAIQMMYIAVPQLFSAILTEPRFAGALPLAPSEVIEMATPCNGAWCRISTIYDFRPGKWYVTSTIRFDPAPKAD